MKRQQRTRSESRTEGVAPLRHIWTKVDSLIHPHSPHFPSHAEGWKRNQRRQNQQESLIETIAVGVQNDQMIKVTALKFKSYVSFGFGSHSRFYGGGSSSSRKCNSWKDSCQSWSPKTANFSRGVAHTIVRHLGHPAWALCLVPKKIIVVIVGFASVPSARPRFVEICSLQVVTHMERVSHTRTRTSDVRILTPVSCICIVSCHTHPSLFWVLLFTTTHTPPVFPPHLPSPCSDNVLGLVSTWTRVYWRRKVFKTGRTKYHCNLGLCRWQAACRWHVNHTCLLQSTVLQCVAVNTWVAVCCGV